MTDATRDRYRDALRARELRLLIWAFVVDAIGGWAYNVVLIVYVYDRTGSPGMIAATTACGWVPRLLLSTYAGVLADRYERTRVMQVSALSCLAVGLLLAAVVAADGPVLLVLGLHTLVAVGATFYSPAARALVPEAVPERDLAAANALFGIFENLVVVGPALGGLLLLTGEPAVGVVFDALTFFVAALLVRSMRLRSSGGGGQAPLLRADRRSAAAFAALRPRIAMLEVLDLLAAAPKGALEQLARVVSGEVSVSAHGEQEQARHLRTLGPRSYFGEIGLLRGGVRTATVQTTEPTVVWRLAPPTSWPHSRPPRPAPPC